MNRILTKILKGSAKELTTSVGDVVDKLSTSEDEKLKAKKEISQVVLENLKDIASFQKEVLITELSGTKLQRNWRPIVMLMFAFIVVYVKFIAPLFNLTNVKLEPQFWELLSIGIGGYVIGRSAEKIAKTVTKNIDLPLIKKKNRKLQEYED